jgi:hypothetical protein
VFDEIRRKWLQLTPEEWVRQHLVHYLVKHLGYPASSIAIEKELRLNDTKKRFDVVVFNRRLQPFLIVECKAPYIALNHEVIQQAQRYNLILKAPFLMISNGVNDLVFTIDNQITSLPLASAITASEI